jgi:hypothetical protein
MTGTGQSRGQLDWLLGDFLRRAPGVVHALVVSGDGLRVAGSQGIDRRLGDQLSAATSGLVSLARGTAQLLQLAPMTQTIVEMGHGHLFVTPINDAATLAVVARLDCDMGLVAYEMTLLAAQVGHALTPAERSQGVARP